MRAEREIPDEIVDIIDKIKAAHPMDVLRTAVSALAAFDDEVEDLSAEATIRKGLRLTAKATTIVAVHDRIRNGKPIVKPNPDLNPRGQLPLHAV